MIFLIRSVIVFLIFSKISDCLRHDSYDFGDFQKFVGPRKYPMLKVAYYDPKIAPKRVKKGEVRANVFVPGGKIANLRSEDSSEQLDNVRAFAPVAREDIKRMKKLSFHGRSSPRAQNVSQDNETSNQKVERELPVQLNLQQRKYKEQQASDARKDEINDEESVENFSSKDDSGFYPIMRPSPITVHPVDPPSFLTVRNYVDILKSRQKDFFADVIEPKYEITTEKQLSEVDYFVKRERELVDEQQPRMEHRNLEHVEVVEPVVQPQDYENVQESKRHESFVPFRLYAQVRHSESEKHRPRFRTQAPHPKEKLTLEKKNVYYKEEGYLEKDYDHGGETVEAKYRTKRDVEDQRDLPVAQAYIKKSALPQLTGEKLLKHLDDLIKNSSIYLPDDDDDEVFLKKEQPSVTIYGGGRSLKSHKYPYYNLPDSQTLNTMSAFRYSENIKNFPRAKQSLYNFKKLEGCQEIDQEVDPVPKDIEEEGKSTSYNNSPKRLNNLGGKIGCYKDKIFGKDPFDNPLFKEKYVSASIPIPLQETSILSHQANPLITVYDDVISNIRAAYADELKLKREKLKEEELKNKVKDAVPAPSVKVYSQKLKPEVKPSSLSSAGVTSRLPLFDINNYYPKLQIPISDETLIPPVIKDKDYEVEIIELPLISHTLSQNLNTNVLPNAPQKATAFVIKNLRPPNLGSDKRWRRNPVSYTVTRSNSPSHYFQPPPKKFKLL